VGKERGWSGLICGRCRLECCIFNTRELFTKLNSQMEDIQCNNLTSTKLLLERYIWCVALATFNFWLLKQNWLVGLDVRELGQNAINITPLQPSYFKLVVACGKWQRDILRISFYETFTVSRLKRSSIIIGINKCRQSSFNINIIKHFDIFAQWHSIWLQ